MHSFGINFIHTTKPSLISSPPTEASIKSFIYHSVPDVLDAASYSSSSASGATDLSRSFSSNGGMTPTSCPQKRPPLLRAISMYQPVHRICKKSDASHKYVTRYGGHRIRGVTIPPFSSSEMGSEIAKRMKI